MNRASREHLGWLLDVYLRPDGTLAGWLLDDDGQHHLLAWDFPVTVYFEGSPAHLRQVWRTLTDPTLHKARVVRQDIYGHFHTLLALTAPSPGQAQALYHHLQRTFPHLDAYDADLPLGVQVMVRTGVPLLGRCRFRHDGQHLLEIDSLASPWDLDPPLPPLRLLRLYPDRDPTLAPPQVLHLEFATYHYRLPLQPLRPFLINLQAIWERCDPDVILSDHGDAWFFPFLQQVAPQFNPNRDPALGVQFRRERTLFAYGQVLYRAPQAHLCGRWHIDRRNAVLFNEIGLDGVFELARVTGLGVQDAARKSPGAGITALQMQTALRERILIPVTKPEAETPRTLPHLIAHDRGGLIYQPLLGVHTQVAEIDFTSMYPAIMVNANISPETLGHPDAPPGLIPRTLQPLLHKRLALKRWLQSLPPQDCRVPTLRARQTALKWLLVVCFGYLGYKNARFGRVESHEAVTARSRELLLQAKALAEDLDFTVLHMYVDSLFVYHPDAHTPDALTPLLEAIERQTGIPVALEGIYRWLVFPPARRHPSLAVANRYFGVFTDGRIKARGIALRRHDTPPFVAQTQAALLHLLAQAEHPTQRVADAWDWVAQQIARLQRHEVDVVDLRMAVKLSRSPSAYRHPGPAAWAAWQLEAQGTAPRPGMRLGFWFTRQGIRVTPPAPDEVDYDRYARLVWRAAAEILEPLTPLPPNRQPRLPLLGRRSPIQCAQVAPSACKALTSR